MNTGSSALNKSHWLMKACLPVFSTYLCLLAIQIVWHRILVRAPPPIVFQDFCPPVEHLRFAGFEGMGPGLVRRQDVGWCLWPGGAGNSKGYLGDSRPYRKAPGTWRVVLLGDSFTGANQLPYHLTFADRLEKELQKRHPDRRIEVINLGVGGYGIDQEYFTLLGEASRYEPDLVIHCVFLGNDINETNFQLYKLSEHPQHRPHPLKRVVTLTTSNTLAHKETDLNYYYQMNISGQMGTNPWVAPVLGTNNWVFFEWDQEKLKLKGRVVRHDDRSVVDIIDDVQFPRRYLPITRNDKPVALEPEPNFFYEFSGPCRWNTNVWTLPMTNPTSLASFEWEAGQWVLHSRSVRAGGQDWVDVDGPVRYGRSLSCQIHLQQADLWIPLSSFQQAFPTQLPGKASQLTTMLARAFSLKDLRQQVVGMVLNMNLSWGKWLIRHGLIREDEAPVFVQLMDYQGGYPIGYQAFFNTYTNAEWPKAWDLSFRLIQEMRAYATNTLRAPFMVCTFPSMETVYPDYWAKARRMYPELDKVADTMDVAKPAAMMNQFLSTNHIPFISFYEVMQEYHRHNPGKLYSPKHAHFNENGHALVASNIVQFITDRSWMPQN